MINSVNLLIHLVKSDAYNFINSMVEESKYWSDVIKKHFNKDLVMTQKDVVGFENSTKCWTCDIFC